MRVKTSWTEDAQQIGMLLYNNWEWDIMILYINSEQERCLVKLVMVVATKRKSGEPT